ncbi:MAG: phage holin family protein [Verrucomicrobiota bacterium]|nr:phage holin family protein [Verrucomicrobiota bacterium]
MAGEPMRFRNPAGHAGLLTNVVSFANSLAAFFECRLALFVRESKGALVHIVLLVAGLIGAIVLLGAGYIFLIVSIVFGIAHAAGVSWVWIAFCAAILHLLLAGGSAFFAITQLKKPMFGATLNELKRDREWLKSTDRKNQPST